MDFGALEQHISRHWLALLEVVQERPGLLAVVHLNNLAAGLQIVKHHNCSHRMLVVVAVNVADPLLHNFVNANLDLLDLFYQLLQLLVLSSGVHFESLLFHLLQLNQPGLPLVELEGSVVVSNEFGLNDVSKLLKVLPDHILVGNSFGEALNPDSVVARLLDILPHFLRNIPREGAEPDQEH